MRGEFARNQRSIVLKAQPRIQNAFGWGWRLLVTKVTLFLKLPHPLSILSWPTIVCTPVHTYLRSETSGYCACVPNQADKKAMASLFPMPLNRTKKQQQNRTILEQLALTLFCILTTALNQLWAKGGYFLQCGPLR